MVGGLLMKSSEFMLRRELFNLSPSPAAAKSLYLPSARVCFRRNNKNTLLSSPGMNHTLVLSAPRHKLDNVILSSSPPHCLSDSCCFENKNNLFIHNSLFTVSDKIDEIKNKVFKLLASLLLFGFLAFMTSPRRSLKPVSALASTSSSSSSTSTSPSLSPSSVSTSCTNCNCPNPTKSFDLCTCNCHIAEIIVYSMLLGPFLSFLALPLSLLLLVASVKMLVAYVNALIILAKILSIILAFYIMAPPVVALLNGFFYFLQLCMDDRKSVLVLQVGVLDKMRELQREFAQITDTSNSDAIKLEGVVKTLVQHYDSCHFAYINVTKCIPDEKTEFKHNNDDADSIFVHDPFQFAVYNRLKCFVSTLVETIHGAVKTNKKINYEDKYSKQLCREVLASELVRYDKDKKTSANIDGLEYENKDVGKENSMVGNDYLVVTVLALASGIYSIPSSMCNTEHVKTALQEFNSTPKSKIESVEVLWTPETEDEVVSEQELQRDFPLLKPIDPSGFEGFAIDL